MAELTWIKLDLDIFSDNRKIQYIRNQPNGNYMVLIWIMLLTLAGRCNNRGKIGVTEDIPYSNQLLAVELGFDEELVSETIDMLVKLKMLCKEDDFIVIKDWENHQNTEAMERAKNSKTNAQKRWRAKQKTNVDDCVDISVDADVDDVKTSTVDAEIISVDDAEIRNKNKKKNKNINKHIYGSFSNVLLTEDEFIRLGKDYGEETRDRAIEYLSSYIKEKHYKSAEHNLSIRRWVMDAISKERRTNSGYKTDIRVKQESTDDNERFYSTYSPEECDRLLAEYEAQGY